MEIPYVRLSRKRTSGREVHRRFRERISKRVPQALWSGKWPSTDWKGRPYDPASPQGRKAGRDLAGGYFGALWVLRGDN